jgi:hypothetical protein
MGAPKTGWLRDADTFEDFDEGDSDAAVYIFLLLAYRKHILLEYRTYRWPVPLRGACYSEVNFPDFFFLFVEPDFIYRVLPYEKYGASIFAWSIATVLEDSFIGARDSSYGYL